MKQRVGLTSFIHQFLLWVALQLPFFLSPRATNQLKLMHVCTVYKKVRGTAGNNNKIIDPSRSIMLDKKKGTQQLKSSLAENKNAE